MHSQHGRQPMHFVALYLNEQHKDGYAILRGGVKEPEPLAVEPTEDAAIEKARKLDPDAAIHVEYQRSCKIDPLTVV
jgi:hypothetical protein